MTTPEARLQIRFHGRVIEHLGIDMYQSPVAAIAELVSNAWDADATRVEVLLPDSMVGIASGASTRPRVNLTRCGVDACCRTDAETTT